MISKKKSSGFTIVELMFGMVGMAILALVVGAMLVYGWMGWRRNMESVEMQRNAMVATRILEHRIRNTSITNIGGFETQTLTFSADPDFSSSVLSEGLFVTVESFNPTTNGLGGVEVPFTLSTTSGTDENVYSITVYPRNP